MRRLYEEVRASVQVPKVVNEWINIFISCAEEMKDHHPEKYAELCNELYVTVYGEHFNEQMAMSAVKGMQNEDGTTGAHFALEETDHLAQRAGVVFSDSTFNRWDWYYTVNMVYSDYYGYIPNDLTSYVNIAKAFIEDKDAAPGKAYRYYVAMKDPK